jgi:ABC-type molybdate transport system substrate-binding protein
MKAKYLRIKTFTAASLADLETAVNEWLAARAEEEISEDVPPQYAPSGAGYTCVVFYTKS